MNGISLWVFGNDILVGRTLQALIALGGVFTLVWIGGMLRDRRFGFLCAFCFLLYPETVINFRWVRPHPLSGVLALVAVGFLIRYVQDRKLRDAACAGLVCSAAAATNYFAYPLIGIVVATVLVVNGWERLRRWQGWRHVVVAGACAGLYAGLFVLWYVMSQPGGLPQLRSQLTLLHESSNAMSPRLPSVIGELAQSYRNLISFALMTPTYGTAGVVGVDLWLIGGCVGMFMMPAGKTRRWLIFWTLCLMSAVFKNRDNVPDFFYPATLFLPLLAIGVAAILVRLGNLMTDGWPHTRVSQWCPLPRGLLRAVPTVALLGGCGLISLHGSLLQFRSKYGSYMVQSWHDAETVMAYVNTHTGSQDYVIVPDQLYWLVRSARKGQLLFAAAFDGTVTQYYGVPIPQRLFWFDCRLDNARYVVLAYGQDDQGKPCGIDAVFWGKRPAIRRLLQQLQAEHWHVVFERGEYQVLANPRLAAP